MSEVAALQKRNDRLLDEVARVAALAWKNGMESVHRAADHNDHNYRNLLESNAQYRLLVEKLQKERDALWDQLRIARAALCDDPQSPKRSWWKFWA